MPLLLRTYKQVFATVQPHARQTFVFIICQQVLSLVAAMHARLVVHLDLKADNILIRPSSSASASDVSLLLGDFGEAMVLGPGAVVMMKQSRGTECIQAPEMLMAG
jgi:serine/threonine protein kinase